MLQDVIVGLIVAWALWVAAARLLPRALRGALRRQAARVAGLLGWARVARRLAAPASAAGGCGGCDSCAGEPAGGAKVDRVVRGISAEALRRTIKR